MVNCYACCCDKISHHFAVHKKILNFVVLKLIEYAKKNISALQYEKKE